MITYFKSQKDLATKLIEVIDSYWSQQISESDFIDYLKTVYKNNTDKFIASDGELTSVIKQRLGKKRANLIIQILNNTKNGEDKIK
jgi:uncharacterized protein (TIGR04540 family)